MTSTLIAALEQLARSPALTLERILEALPADTARREALMGREASAVARAFGEHRTMWCIILAPEDAPKHDDEQQPDRTPDDTPDEAPDERPDPER